MTDTNIYYEDANSGTIRERKATGDGSHRNPHVTVTKIEGDNIDDIIDTLTDIRTLLGEITIINLSLVSGEVVNETPNGILDTFTVDYTFADNSETVMINGQGQVRDQGGISYNYVPDGDLKQIVFNAESIPIEGDVITVSYAKVI
jgi:hypothetical protein